MNSSAPKFSNTDPRYWDQRYGVEAFAYGTEPNVFLKSRVPPAPKKGAKALCLADGEGRNGVYLAQLGYEVTSLDFSPAAQKKALSLAALRGVQLDCVLTDLNTYEIEKNQWDLIASIFYQPVLEVRQRHHQRLFEALKPQGLFILETKVSLEPHERERYPGTEALSKELSRLEIVYANESEQELNEGTYHQGRQRTAQLVAQKP
jgi:cyclopropane fatty-acyl-phospholipid synthase-like methyltransferase